MNETTKKKIDEFIAEVQDDNPFGRPPPIPCFNCGAEKLFFTTKTVNGEFAFIECTSCGIAYTVEVMSESEVRKRMVAGPATVDPSRASKE